MSLILVLKRQKQTGLRVFEASLVHTHTFLKKKWKNKKHNKPFIKSALGIKHRKIRSCVRTEIGLYKYVE